MSGDSGLFQSEYKNCLFCRHSSVFVVVVVQWNTLCMAYLFRSWPERLSASFWTWHWNCCDLSANVYARSLRLCWSSLLYLLHMREVLRLMAWNSCLQAGCVSWYSFCCCCYYVFFSFNIQTWKRWWKFMWLECDDDDDVFIIWLCILRKTLKVFVFQVCYFVAA